MSETLALNPGFVIATAFSIVFVIVYPIVLAIVAHHELCVSWRYVGHGAIVFFVFQLVTRVPAVQLIQAAIGPQLKASPPLMWTWLVVLALSAGVFEEVGRYLGYRLFMRGEDKTWSKAVMFGIGHGGLESVLQVGGLMVLALISLWTAANGGLNQLPDDQRRSHSATPDTQRTTGLGGALWCLGATVDRTDPDCVLGDRSASLPPRQAGLVALGSPWTCVRGPGSSWTAADTRPGPHQLSADRGRCHRLWADGNRDHLEAA